MPTSPSVEICICGQNPGFVYLVSLCELPFVWTKSALSFLRFLRLKNSCPFVVFGIHQPSTKYLPRMLRLIVMILFHAAEIPANRDAQATGEHEECDINAPDNPSGNLNVWSNIHLPGHARQPESADTDDGAHQRNSARRCSPCDQNNRNCKHYKTDDERSKH